jgi:hypothetical protein
VPVAKTAIPSRGSRTIPSQPSELEGTGTRKVEQGKRGGLAVSAYQLAQRRREVTRQARGKLVRSRWGELADPTPVEPRRATAMPDELKQPGPESVATAVLDYRAGALL